MHFSSAPNNPFLCFSGFVCTSSIHLYLFFIHHSPPPLYQSSFSIVFMILAFAAEIVLYFLSNDSFVHFCFHNCILFHNCIVYKNEPKNVLEKYYRGNCLILKVLKCRLHLKLYGWDGK